MGVHIEARRYMIHKGNNTLIESGGPIWKTDLHNTGSRTWSVALRLLERKLISCQIR